MDSYAAAWEAKFGFGGTHAHRPCAKVGHLVPALLKEARANGGKATVWIVYRNDGTKYRDFITCTTEGLAQTQLDHCKKLGHDVVLLDFLAYAQAPREISLENMTKILEAKATT